jgi:exodeoxyribonuclease-3
MKLVSWNVNGLRACLNKGFLEAFQALDADIFCLQETKMQPGQAEIDLPGYHEIWNSAQKKGYSGTAVFTRIKPKAHSLGMGVEGMDEEGRVILLDYQDFYLVNVYTPNSQRELARLDYRMEWEDTFRSFLQELDSRRPVLICGDLNVAHQEIDIKNPKTNRRNAGFTDEERGKMTQLLEAGFADTFRTLHPHRKDAYTWWSFRANARERNIGWRLDYFLASQRLMECVTAAEIHPDIMGSDHCPVSLEIDLSL